MQAVGAAPEGRVGYNTDTTGYERASRAELADAPTDRVTQFGAGGAGSAVAEALARIGIRQLTIVDVQPGRAAALAATLSARHGMTVEALDDLGALPTTIGASDGIVNCTPHGMHDHPGTPFDTSLLRSRQWVSDVVYRPLHTELLRAARARGCAALDGGGMAVFQAADAFELITGIRPDIARMLTHFHRLVDAEEAATPQKEPMPQ